MTSERLLDAWRRYWEKMHEAEEIFKEINKIAHQKGVTLQSSNDTKNTEVITKS